MSADSIGFVTKSIVGRGRTGKDDEELWNGQLLAVRSVEDAEFCAAVAERSRQSAADVKYLLSVANEVLLDFLRKGCHVNLANVGFALSLTGKFPSKDAAADPVRNAVRVTAHAKPSLANAISLSSLNLENQTPSLVARIFSVMDATLRQDGVIADASQVLITGEGLRVDPAAGDEGVWLEDASGDRVAQGTVLENDAASLDCSFAELPPAGSYRIAVQARNGASPTLAPACVRKSVEIK